MLSPSEAQLEGETSKEERELKQRSMKKVKRGSHYTDLNEAFIEVVKMVLETDKGLLDTQISTQRLEGNSESFKDKLMGNNLNLTINRYSSFSNSYWEPNDEDWDTDDDKSDSGEVDDPRCPIIRLTNEEKIKLQRPWRQSLIANATPRV